MTALTRYHPDNETPVGLDWIWVFGSNLAGRHGAGAALVAANRFAAVYGQGVGPTGRAYAIPTKDGQLGVLSLDEIERYVAQFLEYAQAHPELYFYITRIGCGLAGYRDSQIAPLFADAPSNCCIPIQWSSYVQSYKSMVESGFAK
jgi:hypothetical protein